MDRAAKRVLARWLSDRAADGLAVVVATHDAEFAADFATRAVLLADGRVIADGPIEEILAGGWYFTTESARILDGAGGALRPEQGAALLRARMADDQPRRGGPLVSWQLASFAIVLGSVALAFWWYERSHPPAKLVAVVATLAAIAALGRDAFAAVPDVKPITAIVLVSGVAFGAGPGFAVGAISGLASNILLGQGPWTPWQMLGWGLVGLIGAGLGGSPRGGCRRLTIALACALSAEVFNLVVDLYTWTGTGDDTLSGIRRRAGHRRRVRRYPCGRQLRLRPRVRAHAAAHAHARALRAWRSAGNLPAPNACGRRAGKRHRRAARTIAAGPRCWRAAVADRPRSWSACPRARPRRAPRAIVSALPRARCLRSSPT